MVETQNNTKTNKVYRGSVVVIDDEPDMCKILTKALNIEGYHVTAFTSPLRGLEYVQKYRPDLVLTDIKMDELDGMEVLRQVKEIDPNIVVIMITAYGTIEGAIEAMKLGAFHYLKKPFQLDEMLALIDKALSFKRLKDENLGYQEHAALLYGEVEIIGESPAMKKVKELIARIAPTDSSVLIYGESGTGKELVAKAIHQLSPRKNKRFVPINCAGIPETLIESELFGYEKGAFTGATQTKMGLIELANDGTLFLDEIGDLPLPLQAKLLRVLQEREIQRIGGLKQIPVDIRLLAATNRDLKYEMEQGNFRRDLFYRLNVINITLPPLRERREDIPLLIDYFLKKYSRSARNPQIRFSPSAIEALMNYNWQGNVRELENIIERLTVLIDKPMIEREDLPADIIGVSVSPRISADYRTAREEFERNYIIELLRRTQGNVSDAARLAGLSRRHLYDKIEKYKINLDEIKKLEK